MTALYSVIVHDLTPQAKEEHARWLERLAAQIRGV